MFSEHKKKQDELKKDRNGELIFDELEAKTGKMKISEEGKKEKLYTSSDEIDKVKKRSIKKSDKRDSTVSLNMAKVSESASSNRSNSIESSNVGQNVGFGIFEAASMMCNIVDITTDSTTGSNNKNKKTNSAKPLKSVDSKTSLTGSGPFAQLKEAQEMKKRNKTSFDEIESDE